jgi:hypothetical protein
MRRDRSSNRTTSPTRRNSGRKRKYGTKKRKKMVQWGGEYYTEVTCTCWLPWRRPTTNTSQMNADLSVWVMQPTSTFWFLQTAETNITANWYACSCGYTPCISVTARQIYPKYWTPYLFKNAVPSARVDRIMCEEVVVAHYRHIPWCYIIFIFAVRHKF